MFDSDLERRALANLPRYRTDEEQAAAEQEMRDANDYGPDWGLVRTRPPEYVAERLTRDKQVDGDRVVDAAEAGGLLAGLTGKGYAVQYGAEYGMTTEGLDALQA